MQFDAKTRIHFLRSSQKEDKENLRIALLLPFHSIVGYMVLVRARSELTTI